MAKSVNKVILIGNLGKDPEVKYTQTGMAVARFSVATADRVKDKEGNWQERTEWHNLVAFQRTAEIAGEYLKKGSKVYIEGRLHSDSWDDKETGQKKYKTEIIINDLVLLGGGGPREGGGEGGGYSGRSGPASLLLPAVSTSALPNPMSRKRLPAAAARKSPTKTYHSRGISCPLAP
jgi:single-strand DNA-binding protein